MVIEEKRRVTFMYELGEYVVYGNNGVCKVDSIGPLSMDSANKDRIYYTLSPLYSNGSTVFTPVDSANTKLRPIISKSQADQLLDEMEEIDLLDVDNDKKREEVYKEAYKTYECREWVKIIKTSYLRKQKRLQEGKHATSSDEKYLHLAEESLYGELAIPLRIPKGEVEDFIRNHIGQTVI